MSEPIRLRDWKEVIFMDFPPMIVNGRAIDVSREAAQSGRYAPVDVRLATGRAYTKESYQEMRKRELSRPLP